MIDLLSNEEYLNFVPEDVIYRFSKSFDLPEAEILDIFNETKKFLALYKVGKIVVTPELGIIDEMWHTFILFMQQYEEFCVKFFGKVIIHVPTSKKEFLDGEAKFENSKEEAIEEIMQLQEYMMNLTYDYLGEETLIKWFKTYPKKYYPDAILKIRKAF